MHCLELISTEESKKEIGAFGQSRRGGMKKMEKRNVKYKFGEREMYVKMFE